MSKSHARQKRNAGETRRSALDAPGAFAGALVRWFAEGAKDYPWRRTRDPYAILVSELMLQQTQVATVLSRRYFERWMEQFPTPAALAAAPEEAVLKAWEGLGYYRRARNLQKAAATITTVHAGQFPRELVAILALPGVGRYTAGAVASFAFGDGVPIVDGNVARVLARLFDFHGEIDSAAGQRQLWAWAEELVPERGAREYNSALMELGQTHCSISAPDCAACPVAQFCQTSTPEALPNKKPRVKTSAVDEHARLVVRGERVLLEQEPGGGRREGLWKLPELPESRLGVLEPLLEMKYSITRYRVTLRVYSDPQGGRAPSARQAWFDRSEVQQLPMPSPYRKALVAIWD